MSSSEATEVGKKGSFLIEARLSIDMAIIERLVRFMNVVLPFACKNRNSQKAVNVIIIYSETSKHKTLNIQRTEETVKRQCRQQN